MGHAYQQRLPTTVHSRPRSPGNSQRRRVYCLQESVGGWQPVAAKDACQGLLRYYQDALCLEGGQPVWRRNNDGYELPGFGGETHGRQLLAATAPLQGCRHGRRGNAEDARHT